MKKLLLILAFYGVGSLILIFKSDLAVSHQESSELQNQVKTTVQAIKSPGSETVSTRESKITEQAIANDIENLSPFEGR